MSGEARGGHAHFLERALAVGLSRSQFLRRTAAAAGGLAGLGLLDAAKAFAAGADPKPIPGGFSEDFTPVTSDPFIHVLPPAPGFEMSTITDLNGVVAAAELQGSATGTAGSRFDFDTDMRLMQGVYAAMEGRLRRGSFAFI
jgi:hypothetical protein